MNRDTLQSRAGGPLPLARPLILILLLGLLALAACLPGASSTPTPVVMATTEPATTMAATPTLEATATDASPSATATATPSATSAPGAEATPAPTRISFAAGESSATMQGTLGSSQRHYYVFRAQAGQEAHIEVTSTGNAANFGFSGAADGQPYKRLVNEDRFWDGVLPENQDYLLHVAALEDTEYTLTLEIAPLSSDPEVPVVYNEGQPPTDRCVAVHPGGTAVVDVRQGPGQEYALIAHLSNWAEVLSSREGWYEIVVGPGQSGWVDREIAGLVGPCDSSEAPTRIEMPPGSTAGRAWGNLAPGGLDRYVFRAPAGQRVLLEVLTSDEVRLGLMGQDDAVFYKAMSDPQTRWEGVLPQEQDYVISVASAGDSAGYEVLIGFLNSPPLVAVYDVHTGRLLGGARDAQWVDAETTAAALLGGETYDYYHLVMQEGQATGSAPQTEGGVCPGISLTLTSEPPHPAALAVAGASWDVAPRLAGTVEETGAHRQAIADLLHDEGLEVSATDVLIREMFTIDLDGNGMQETIIRASRLKADGSTPEVDAGDYAVVAVQMDVDGQVYTEPLVVDVYSQAQELAYPWRYKTSGLLDLDGDGKLEVVLTGVRWEGRQTTVYGVGSWGGVVAWLQAGCGL